MLWFLNIGYYEDARVYLDHWTNDRLMTLLIQSVPVRGQPRRSYYRVAKNNPGITRI